MQAHSTATDLNDHPHLDDFLKTYLFSNEEGKPYRFYLCPPINTDLHLIQMIEDNGGIVVDNYIDESCVILSKGNIPDDLKEVHIYSYKVIEDCVNGGSLKGFPAYTIHTPMMKETPFTDYQYDPYFGYNNNNNTNTNNGTNSENKLVPFGSVRYFTAEEDTTLREELRKRHWMGIKGHSVYEKIASLPYFQERGRTASSLRERMRTLKFNIGYVYKVDKRNRLVRDKNGHYIKCNIISNKLVHFTAEDDFIFCKTIFLNLEMEIDDTGFEKVTFPTGFYDKFASVYNNHTSESWRQRYKNYLSIFGVINYLKYFIRQFKLNLTPLPANIANKEWLISRKESKGSTKKLYFPDVPLENDYLPEALASINLEGYDKPFEFENPLLKKHYIQENKLSKFEMSTFENELNLPTRPTESPTFESEINLPTRSTHTPTFESQINSPIGPTHSEIIKSATDIILKSKSEPEIDQDNTSVTGLSISSPLDKFYNLNYNARFMLIPLNELDKDEFIANINKILMTENPTSKDLFKALFDLGVKRTYIFLLIYRCLTNLLRYESLVNYVNTKGEEILINKPGVITTESYFLLKQKNDKVAVKTLKKIHGKYYKDVVKAFRTYRKKLKLRA